MVNRMSTRVDPRTQHSDLIDQTTWYDNIFIAPQISLAIFGIHITHVPNKYRVLHLLWRGLLTGCIAVLTLVYLIENTAAMAGGLCQWHHIKWFMASLTAAFTMGYILVRLQKLRSLVEFYRINYNSWRTSQKRSVRIRISYMTPIIWFVVLAAGGDFALNAQDEIKRYFDALGFHGGNKSDATAAAFEAFDGFVRWVVITGVISFVAFIYGVLVLIVVGNIGHLNMWMRSQEITEFDEGVTATSLSQLRNLIHHQEANLRQLDELFSPLVSMWYVMCTINVMANIHLTFEGAFPGAHTSRILFNLFMECFPWYAIVWGSTGAAEDIQTQFQDFIEQLEQTVFTLNGKNIQTPINRPVFSVLLWMQKASFRQPQITLAGWLPIRRSMLLGLVTFFILYAGVFSLAGSSGRKAS